MFTNIDTLPLGKVLQPVQGKKKKTQVSTDPGKMISKLFGRMPQAATKEKK